ncbi:MAG: transcriptional regulator [Deltaproteobacteria bacterium]|nr:transcriptional regulator [Deltaproteobacteria bacterium]
MEAFAGINGNAGTKQISEITGLDAKVVTKAIKELKALSYIESPVRCKYTITDSGKKIV